MPDVTFQMPEVTFRMPLKLHSRDGRWRCARASANTCTSANTLTIAHARTRTRTRTRAQDTPLPKRILSLIPGTPDTPWCACALHGAHTHARTRAPRSSGSTRIKRENPCQEPPPKQTGAARRRTRAPRRVREYPDKTRDAVPGAAPQTDWSSTETHTRTAESPGVPG